MALRSNRVIFSSLSDLAIDSILLSYLAREKLRIP